MTHRTSYRGHATRSGSLSEIPTPPLLHGCISCLLFQPVLAWVGRHCDRSPTRDSLSPFCFLIHSRSTDSLANSRSVELVGDELSVPGQQCILEPGGPNCGPASTANGVFLKLKSVARETHTQNPNPLSIALLRLKSVADRCLSCGTRDYFL
jgi:hypothetical protein